MNNLNSCLIEGNMIRDPEYKQTPRGTWVCNFTIATSRYYKGEGGLEKEVSFFDIESWGKLAESCGKLGRKGRGVRIVGRLRQDRWNGADGKPHSRIILNAEHVEFRPETKAVYAEFKETDYVAEVPPPDEGVDELSA